VVPPPVSPPVVTAPVAPPPEPPSTTLRIVGWSMIGAGVAADVVAVIEGIRAKNRGDQLTQMSSSGSMPPFNPNIQSEGKTANIIAIVCGIAGTAVAVAGAVVLITNGSSSSSPSETPVEPGTTVSFTPWLAPGLAGGGVGLRF
jgi:hypothetical protein